MLEDRESISVKMEDPENAVEFRDATLAWEKARPPQGKGKASRKRGGMRSVLRREKLSLYISSEEEKSKDEGPNAQHLLTHMEQESPQSTISSTQSIRPLLHKTLHRIHLHIRKVPPPLALLTLLPMRVRMRPRSYWKCRSPVLPECSSIGH